MKSINLNVPQGAVVGLIGENGAGKTTLIKLLLNTVQRDQGEISILGKELLADEKEIKEQIGTVLEGSFFPETLKIENIQKIMRCFYSRWDQTMFEHYCHRFKLPYNKAIKNFSKGMRMKLAIACALSHHARLLILDEPTSGLDPIVRSEILELFREFIQDETHSILISSHITSDLEQFADYIALMKDGEIVLYESYSALCEDYGIVRCDENDLKKLSASEYLCWRRNQYSVDVLVRDLSAFQQAHPELLLDRCSLEEVMLLIVKGEKTA